MAAPIKPALKRAFGNDSWLWVPAIADITEPTDTEVLATAGFNLSCSVFSEQEGVTSTTEKVSLPMLLCEKETYEVNGSTSYSAADLMVSFDPQAASGADGKLAWESMDDYADGFLVYRQSVDSKTEPATDDFVNVFPASLGRKSPTKTGADAAGVYAFQVSASITGRPEFNVQIVAGA